jgi:hypothetical protein
MPPKFFDGVATKPAIGGSWFTNMFEAPPQLMPTKKAFRFISAWKKTGTRAPRWPQSSWMGASLTGTGDMLFPWRSLTWGNSRWKHGTNQRFRIDGITRDVYGTPMPNCTVLCLGQVAGDIVYTTLSDTTGAYIVYTPYYGAANIVVSYKAAPDIAGAVINVQGI